MTLSRIELDDFGSPADLAARIHELAPDLGRAFRIEDVCHLLDIHEIRLTDTKAFEAALIMDANRAAGTILLAAGSPPRRRRFSLGHELGHFLMPTHKPINGDQFSCSLSDLRMGDAKDRDRHRRIEAEANRFAAQLLMPPKRIRASLTSRQPDLVEIVRLANDFDVSKEAMARSYVDAHPAALAIVVLQRGRVDRLYRGPEFPWIDPPIGARVPNGSVASEINQAPGYMTEMEECDVETWIGERASRAVEALSEQALVQHSSYMMVLLHAELGDTG